MGEDSEDYAVVLLDVRGSWAKTQKIIGVRGSWAKTQKIIGVKINILISLLCPGPYQACVYSSAPLAPDIWTRHVVL